MIQIFIKKYLKTLSFIFLCVVWILVSFKPLLLPLQTHELDAYSRLDHIVNRAVIDVWLPGHMFFMSVFGVIPDNGYFTNYRFGNYLFTFSTSIILFLIARRLTLSFWFSLLSIGVYLFHPLTIQLSVLPMSETVWLFFLFASIFFLFVLNNKKWTMLGIVFYIFSESVRYESWVLLPAVLIILFFVHKKNIKLFYMYTFLLLVFPVSWAIFQWFRYSNPFLFLSIKINNAKVDLDMYFNLNIILMYIKENIDDYIYHVFSLLFLTVCSCFSGNKFIKYLSLLTVYLVSFFIVETFFGYNENLSPRYFYFLVPYFSVVFPCFLFYFSSKIKLGNFANLLVIFIILMGNKAIYGNLNNFYVGYGNENIESEKYLADVILPKTDPVYVCSLVYNDLFLIKYKMKFNKIYECPRNIDGNELQGNILVSKEYIKLYKIYIPVTEIKEYKNYILYKIN